MKQTSDQQHLLSVKRNGPQGPYDLYKASIAVANIGAVHEKENELSSTEKNLLNIRRLIFNLKFNDAETEIKNLKTGHPLLEGDRQFLLAQIFHRKGQQNEAYSLMNLAGDLYHLAGENYREMRARINGAICIGTLDSCLYGELLAYEQEARRLGYMDLAANICRTRAIELLIVGQLSKSYYHAMDAAELYRLDGYPDDLSVAIVLAAISQFMNGEVEASILTLDQCLIKEGKVKLYLDVFENLSKGRTPKLHVGHPLFAVKWSKNTLKTESIPGKIFKALKEKSCTKDELILAAWGNSAQDVSYVTRLHTTIKYLRKEKAIDVKFDGEKYSL